MPSTERLTRIWNPPGPKLSDEASQTPWAASYPTLGSLARGFGFGPGDDEDEVTPGRSPLRHARPPSDDVEKPIAVAPPVAIRPTWKTATTVLPNEKLSGSTSVACWPPAPRTVSVETCR